MYELTSAGQRRLERLRAALPRISYAWQEATWADDPSGSIAVCIDPTAWVVDVAVGDLAEPLRDESAFTQAVRDAYLRADLNRIARGRAMQPDAAESDRAGAELLAGTRTLTPRLIEPPRPIARPTSPVTTVLAADVVLTRDRVHRGVSRDGEVEVGIRWDCGLVDLRVEPRWLIRAGSSDIRYALKEAFGAAYDEGELA